MQSGVFVGEGVELVLRTVNHLFDFLLRYGVLKLDLVILNVIPEVVTVEGRGYEFVCLYTMRLPNFVRHKLVAITPPDRNKFVDCAIGANVDYLVTEDNHILNLLKVPNLFPPVPVVTFDQFRDILANL